MGPEPELHLRRQRGLGAELAEIIAYHGRGRLLDESVALDMVSMTGPKVTPQAIG